MRSSTDAPVIFGGVRGDLVDHITVNLPITWKSVVTERLKEELVKEARRSIGQLDIELQQLEFQAKRMLPDLEKQNLKRAMDVRLQLDEEREKRQQAKERAQARLREIEALNLGDEITRGTLQRIVRLEVGTSLEQLLRQEILTKDGVVVELRQG
ncbi:MAG: 16S rRNA processing protein RimM [Firmicutes bacterium]|nr:16S rRNA processing protein RimM [Bacillota bacterium]